MQSSYSASENEDSVIRLSLCKSAFKEMRPTTEEQMAEIFESRLVDYDLFAEKPTQLIKDENMVVQIDSQYFDWEAGAPLILSYLVFKQPLPLDSVGRSLNQVYLEE